MKELEEYKEHLQDLLYKFKENNNMHIRLPVVVVDGVNQPVISNEEVIALNPPNTMRKPTGSRDPNTMRKPMGSTDSRTYLYVDRISFDEHLLDKSFLNRVFDQLRNNIETFYRSKASLDLRIIDAEVSGVMRLEDGRYEVRLCAEFLKNKSEC